MKNRILIVDDEIDLLDILAYNLIKNGYEVETSTSGEEAFDKVTSSPDSYSLILLDVMMRGINGFDTARKLRERNIRMPIIFLTALDTEPDLLKGFSVGADDYISKPFSVKEVLARVKAVLLRVPQQDKRLTVENLAIEVSTKEVFVDGEEINLTKTEYLLLLLLLQNRGRIYSREELLENVWAGDAFVEIRTVDVHIARLRKKLLSAGSLIVNRSGYGYYIKK